MAPFPCANSSVVMYVTWLSGRNHEETLIKLGLDRITKCYYIRVHFRRGMNMPASYRREVEYDRTRTSLVNPPPESWEEFLDMLGVDERQLVTKLPDHIDGDDYRHVLEPESF